MYISEKKRKQNRTTKRMRKENIIEKSRAVNAAGVGMSAGSTALGWKVSDFSQDEQSGCWYLQSKTVRLPTTKNCVAREIPELELILSFLHEW